MARQVIGEWTVDEDWQVQTRSRHGGWATDTSGPHVLYPNEDEAFRWAAKLAIIHERVRLMMVTRKTRELI
jgi:hypothetical protein